MDPALPIALGGTALLSALIYGPLFYRNYRRRLAFREAAKRAGLDPGDGKWVDAPCAGTRIVGREIYATHARSNPTKWTEISAEIPGKFPEAFHASADANATGVVRMTFPTRSGKRTVFVRGLVEAETIAVITDDVRDALAEGLDLAFDAELVPGALRLSRRKWYRQEEIVATFSGFARMCRALTSEPGAYR